nr:recombinase family protein [Cellulomonas fulva]
MERQVEAAEQYAAARGWQVVATFRDEGVSATHNKPEDRAGWRALLDSPEKYDAVLVWKIDRLARRVLDFLHADASLQERGAGIVAVEDPVDMTTPQGRAFATLLAVFGEMEAEAIRARVKAARDHLLRAGRVVGGTVPYGWRKVANPDGPGYVLAQDPERVGWVRGMVERAQAGASVYSIVQWLDEAGAPLPEASQSRRKAGGWSYSTVERLLRNPLVAGMTAYNPGNRTKERGTDVLRDADGLPVVDESVALLSPGEWRALVKALDERDTAQSKPVALRAKTSALLSGLLWCEADGTRLHRGTINGRHGYYCPECHQSISNFEEALVAEFLRQKGEHVRWSVVEEVYEGGAAVLPEIEHRLAELSDALRATDDDAEADRLMEQIGNLRAIRREARGKAPKVEYRPVRGTQRFGDDWADAETVEDRRAILEDGLERVWVSRGRPGRTTDAQRLARLRVDWKQPEHLGPLARPSDADLAAWAE